MAHMMMALPSSLALNPLDPLNSTDPLPQPLPCETHACLALDGALVRIGLAMPVLGGALMHHRPVASLPAA